jgi:hypothetical protein
MDVRAGVPGVTNMSSVEAPELFTAEVRSLRDSVEAE